MLPRYSTAILKIPVEGKAKSEIGGFTLNLKHHRHNAVWAYEVESEGLVVGSLCVRWDQ